MTEIDCTADVKQQWEKERNVKITEDSSLTWGDNWWKDLIFIFHHCMTEVSTPTQVCYLAMLWEKLW